MIMSLCYVCESMCEYFNKIIGFWYKMYLRMNNICLRISRPPLKCETLLDYSALKHEKRAINNKKATNNGKSASPASTLWYESKSLEDEKPSGSSNSHFTDRDEEEAECSGVIAIATRLATTSICRLGLKAEKMLVCLFVFYPSKTWISSCVRTETHLFFFLRRCRSP